VGGRLEGLAGRILLFENLVEQGLCRAQLIERCGE
jgi:hypothetical protein